MMISVIIPTFNRLDNLSHCLRALSNQILEQEWEVIVVNDGGEDLSGLVDSFNDKINVRLFNQSNKGPASARNLGAKHSKGEYLVFIDDDCSPKKDWLFQLAKWKEEKVIVGGQTRNKLSGNLYAETSQQLISYLYRFFADTPWYFFTSNNFLLDKKHFVKVDGFDESFTTSAGEDREFCVRWRNEGYQMKYIPEAVILHSHDLNFASFWKLHFKYGQATVKYMRKLQGLGIENLKPQLTFYLGLLSFSMQLQNVSISQKVKITGLMIITQLATLFGVLNSTFLKSNNGH